MRRLYVVVFVFLLAAGGQAQWLEKNLWLPDSMTGVGSSNRILFNPLNHHAYIGGNYGDSHGLQIFDYATRTKAGFNRSIDRVEAMFLCPDRQRVLVADEYGGLFSLDALTDSVLARIDTCWPSCGVYNPLVHKAYLGEYGGWLSVFDPGPDTLIRHIDVPQDMMTLELDSATNRLFGMVWSGTAGIQVIDCVGDTLVGVLPTMDNHCDDLAFDPSTRRLYCEGGNRTTRLPEVWVYDVDSLALLDTIALPADWEGVDRTLLLNPVAGRLYVVCFFGDGTDDTGDTVAVIDCATNRIRGFIGLKEDSEVRDLALNRADNKVYVSGWGLDSVAVLGVPDSITNWVRTGASVSCAGWNPENDELLMPSGDILNVVSGANDSIVARVDYRSFDVQALAWNPAGDKLYAFGRNGVMVIDAQNNVARWLRTDYGSVSPGPAASAELNRFYIPVHDVVPSIAVFDCNGDTVLRTSQLPFWPYYLAFTVPAYHKVYWPGYNDSVAVYDTYLDSVVKTKGGFGDGFVYNPRTDLVYGFFAYDPRVRVIDPHSDMVTRLISVRPVSCLEVNGTDNELYVGSPSDSALYVVNCATNTVEDTISLPQAPGGLRWYEPLNKLYVYGNSAAMVVDCRTRAVTRVIPVDTLVPGAGVFAVRNDKLWLASADSMYVISCLLDSIVAAFPGGTTANMAWNSIDNRVYQADGNLLRIYRDDFTGLEAEAARVPVKFSLRLGSNPASGEVRFECGPPGRTPGLLRVYDAMGRQVWSAAVAAGSHTVVWPGSDRQGRSAAAGVYLARLESGESHATAKVVLR